MCKPRKVAEDPMIQTCGTCHMKQRLRPGQVDCQHGSHPFVRDVERPLKGLPLPKPQMLVEEQQKSRVRQKVQPVEVASSPMISRARTFMFGA